MTDQMRPLPFDVLLRWVQCELEASQTIFGIPRSQFFVPETEPAFATSQFGDRLHTPIGPAAGPHTQLAQNIISAWLTGGRFIELKTVQVLDELDIPRPCIDLADEGYNVEWSQELRLNQSAREYAHAWAMIHALRRLLSMDHLVPFGTIFNMSVGYNLEGILSEPMQRFMDTLEDASEILEPIQQHLAKQPGFSGLKIPTRIANSVTLSTMHGCPPDEIERIARYLLESRGLHTTVKLNPTLLGRETVDRLLHDELGYVDIRIPDHVFEQDLGFDRALDLIARLQKTASSRGLSFAVKLSNTLAMANHRGVLPGDEMYMSGRALFPLTITLFERLVDAFDGDLRVSYSAGADELNVPELLAAGAMPVTVASDLLKPGGYAKLGQYLAQIDRHRIAAGAGDLATFANDRRARLRELARRARTDARYQKSYKVSGLPKTTTPLEPFDCIEPPCVEPCAVRQDIPDYIDAIAAQDPDRALSIILSRNPLPASTGYVCTNLCQTRCTRNNNDRPVAIRKLKRFAEEKGHVPLRPIDMTGRRVAIIGSGPSGLSAAFFLALSGVQPIVYEARDRLGGMLAIAPTFRLPAEVVDRDIDRIRQLGAVFRTDSPVTHPPEALLREGYDAVYVACGYANDSLPNLDGIQSDGVFGALDFLRRVRAGTPIDLGEHVLIVGGGNTAVDAARTACRLLHQPATVIYRRTEAEMPAESEEIEDLRLEGNRLIELASPIRVVHEAGRVIGLECVRNRLGPPGPDGRRRPLPVPGSEFLVDATAVIFATGQRPDASFLHGTTLEKSEQGTLIVHDVMCQSGEGVYAGGDFVRGPETIIAACADGRRAAQAICQRIGAPFRSVPWSPRPRTKEDLLASKAERARTRPPTPSACLPPASRVGFDLVEGTFTAAEAQLEASRCLQCASLCDKCVEVCPNRANLAINVDPVTSAMPVYAYEGELQEIGEDSVQIRQVRQIVHIEDFCNACGNCATFCVHPGEPFRVKPRFFLTWDAFQADPECSYRMTPDAILRKDGAQQITLTRSKDGFVFAAGPLRADLRMDGRIEHVMAKAPFAGVISLAPALELITLYKGIRSGAPFLMTATEPRPDERSR